MALAEVRPITFIKATPTVAEKTGPPHNGSMEARISALETFAQDAKDRMTRVEIKLDHIEKEVVQFKWWIIAQIVAGMLAVLGTGIAIQQMTVATFQGAAQVAKDVSPSATTPAQQAPIIINVPAAAAAPATKK